MTRAAITVLVLANAAFAQRPSDADATALIERVREKALAYTKSLPDFECTEVVRRYSNLGAPRIFGLSLKDKLTIRIRYSQRNEEHRLMLIDDEPTDVAYESLQGSIGSGEFGTMLSAIFEKVRATAFLWQSWKTDRKHRVALYSYVVDAAHSRYILANRVDGKIHQAVVGYHGVLEIDSETAEVLQFSYVVSHVPKELNIDAASTTANYDFADVGGRPYLLPAKAQTKIEAQKISARSDMEFRDYQKFNAESSIDFGTVK